MNSRRAFWKGMRRLNSRSRAGLHRRRQFSESHLLPALGTKRLDAIKNEDVQELKSRLVGKAPKTVNNVLTVLNTLLKKAMEWQVMDRASCTIRLLRVVKQDAAFHDFARSERLVNAARAIGWRTWLIVLLGAEAGLRGGEVVALEWRDADLPKRQLCVRRSDWKGQVTAPKSGRIRWVPLTKRLAAALKEHRHLRSQRVLCKADGTTVN